MHRLSVESNGPVLGNSLGSFGNSVLGELTREHESDSGLNSPGIKGLLAEVCVDMNFKLIRKD